MTNHRTGLFVDDETASVTLGRGPNHARITVLRTDQPDPHGERRTTYRWRVDAPGPVHASGDDLHTGVDVDDGPRAMLATLLSFLGAAAESWNYAGTSGENANLFPSDVVQWAAQESDELAMLQDELETTP